MPRNRVLVLAMIVALLASVTTPARGDGKFFRTELAARDPSIPHQTAMISFRDGVQTMIVQSTVNAQGDEVGWILPLPAQPTAIEPVTPGTLATLHQLVQPAFITDRDMRGWLRLATVFAFSFAVMLLAACVMRQTKTPAWPAVEFVVALGTIAFLVVGVLLPAMARTRNAADAPVVEAGTKVLHRGTVGSYNVSVIAARSGAEVRDWLTGNGFACDAAAVTALDGYEAEGWCFAAAKIRWSEDETLAPHPLKVVFPVAEAVYPMRLTGVGATQPLALDLFIFGEEMAQAPGLSVWRCEPLARESIDWYDGPIDQYKGESTRLRFGHPQITSLLWDGAVLTHLSGSLAPVEMAAGDVSLAWQPAQTYQREFLTESAEQSAAYTLMLAVVAVTLLLTSLATLRRTTSARRIVTVVLLPGLGLAVLSWPVFIRLVPSVHVTVDPDGWDRIFAADTVATDLYIEEYKPQTSAAAYVNMLLHNPPQHLVRGDVPNGVVIEEDEAGWTIVVYDRDATPQTFRVAKPEE